MSKNDTTSKLAKAKASLERWQRRQTRAANAVSRLLKTIKRLERKPAEPPKALPKPAPKAIETDHMNEAQFEKFAKALPKPVEPPAGPLDIPAILDRRSEATKRADRERLAKLNDTETAAAIKAEHAELKKKKAAGKAALRKAKLSGETRRMPLQGKAALEAIRKSE